VGYQSLSANTTGSGNVAVGMAAMAANTRGINNTAVGLNAMTSTTNADGNVAIGDHALFSNTNGFFNVAVGSGALYLNSTGMFNTAIGLSALQGNSTGSGNTAIGDHAGGIATDLENITAIGADAFVNVSNKIRLGNSAVTVIEGQVPFTSPSDGRFKFNVQENVKGLNFILQLRPVTYQFDVQRFDNELRSSTKQVTLSKEETRFNELMQKNYAEASQIRRAGFIAQEVEKAAIKSGFDFSGIIKPKSDKDHYGLSYESFVVPLVKAAQELNTKAEKQQQIIDRQQQDLQLLKQQVAELTKIIATLKEK
jgi:hypothetical protein